MNEEYLIFALLAFAFGVGLVVDTLIFLVAPKIDKWLHGD